MKKILLACMVSLSLVKASELSEIFFNYGVIESKINNFDPFARETRGFAEFVMNAVAQGNDYLYKVVFLKHNKQIMCKMHQLLCNELVAIVKSCNALRGERDAMPDEVVFNFEQSKYSYFQTDSFDDVVSTFFVLKYYCAARTKHFSNAEVAHYWRIFDTICRTKKSFNDEIRDFLSYIYGYCKSEVSRVYCGTSRPNNQSAKFNDKFVKALDEMHTVLDVVPTQQNIEVDISLSNTTTD